MSDWSASARDVRAIADRDVHLAGAVVHFSKRFYRFAAACSFLSAATTLSLIFLPYLYGPASGIEARVQLLDSPAYMLRAWIYLLHPAVVFSAALGVATVVSRHSAGSAVVGLIGFFVWAFTEAAQQALTLVAFNRWAAAYPGADAGTRALLESQIATYDAVWDSMFFLLLLGFLVGNLVFGLALVRREGFERLLGALFALVGLLTLLNVSQLLGGPGLPEALGPWLYPIVQPATRILIGVWLLGIARELGGGPGEDVSTERAHGVR